MVPAPVAQRIRAMGFYPTGRGFESLPGYQLKNYVIIKFMNIKVICLNLWQGGNLMDNIIDFLQSEDADILMLQEVYSGTDLKLPRNYRSLEVLNSNLSYKYQHHAPTMLDRVPEGKIEQGNAVFSKLPIINSEVTFFDIPYREREAFNPKEFPTTPRNLQHVTIKLKNQNLDVFNFQGVWDMKGDRYSPERQNMSKVILEQTKDYKNVIIAGDTNATPNNQAIKDLESGFTNVFKGELTTTFNMKHKTLLGYATAVVDAIFVSPNIKVTKHYCPNIDISDHLPLVAVLNISNK